MKKNRENIILAMQSAAAQLEVEKYDLIRKIWVINNKIEEIKQKMKIYGESLS